LRAQYSLTAQTPGLGGRLEPANIALALSRRLVAVVKVKQIVNIEAGLEMMALALTISSQVLPIYFIHGYFTSLLTID
jgi:hypothetical protein